MVSFWAGDDYRVSFARNVKFGHIARGWEITRDAEIIVFLVKRFSKYV